MCLCDERLDARVRSVRRVARGAAVGRRRRQEPPARQGSSRNRGTDGQGHSPGLSGASVTKPDGVLPGRTVRAAHGHARRPFHRSRRNGTTNLGWRRRHPPVGPPARTAGTGARIEAEDASHGKRRPGDPGTVPRRARRVRDSTRTRLPVPQPSCRGCSRLGARRARCERTVGLEGEELFTTHRKWAAVTATLLAALREFHASHPLAQGRDMEELRDKLPWRIPARLFRAFVDSWRGEASSLAREACSACPDTRSR